MGFRSPGSGHPYHAKSHEHGSPRKDVLPDNPKTLNPKSPKPWAGLCVEALKLVSVKSKLQTVSQRGGVYMYVLCAKTLDPETQTSFPEPPSDFWQMCRGGGGEEGVDGGSGVEELRKGGGGREGKQGGLLALPCPICANPLCQFLLLEVTRDASPLRERAHSEVLSMSAVFCGVYFCWCGGIGVPLTD